MSADHVAVMITTSYPRFDGDTIGTFMEPIAKGIAARGHQVHVVLPWHPRLSRGPVEHGVHFHPSVPPSSSEHVWLCRGPARRCALRLSAIRRAMALLASFQAARRVARQVRATVIHGHWLIPSGVIATAVGRRLPTVISLHGSDVYVAERHGLGRRAARATLGRVDWVTACSDDLRDRAIALGADPKRIETIPYGVDVDQFRPDPTRRAAGRSALAAGPGDFVLFTAGRFVRKKGFEYLIEAVAGLAPRWPGLRLVIAGGGDLDGELRRRAREAGIAGRVQFTGVLPQRDVAAWLAAADVAVMPSCMTRLATWMVCPTPSYGSAGVGHAAVATTAGGIRRWSVTHRAAGARRMPGRSAAIDRLLADPDLRMDLAARAREESLRLHTWDRVAERFEQVYDWASRRARERRGTV